MLGEGIRSDAGDDDAIDLSIDERVDVPRGVALVDLGEEHCVALVRGDAFGAGHDVGVHGIAEARHEEAEGEGASVDQALGEAIGAVPERLGGLQNALAGRLGDAGGWILGEDERDGWLRDAGLAGDVGGGDPWLAKSYWHVANTH